MENVLYRNENGIGYITLNRPDKANAMIPEIKKELTAILRSVRVDRSIRAIVITGNGKAFCAGGDLSSMGEGQTAVDGHERLVITSDWLRELVNLEKPSIAAVNGAAYGSGLSLALACDIIIASETAKLCCSFVKVGLLPDMAALYFLPRRVGIGNAKLLTFNGDPVTGAEALKMGLVDIAVPLEELPETVKNMAERFSNAPTYTLGMAKRLINQSYESNFSSFLDLEAGLQAVAFQSEDHRNAVKSFFAKTVPQFRGR